MNVTPAEWFKKGISIFGFTLSTKIDHHLELQCLQPLCDLLDTPLLEVHFYLDKYLVKISRRGL